MATLQTIRNRAGVLIAVVIGIALLGFILDDLLRSGGFLFSDSQYEIAKINGNSIELQEYQQKVDELTENTKRNSGKEAIDEQTAEMIKDQAWEGIIKSYIMEKEYDELGIGVCADELFDIVQGNNIHPQVQQIPIFQNKATGQFDRTLVIQFLKNIDKDETGVARSSWLAFEEALTQDQKTAKYNNLIKKGLYITNYQAKQEALEKNNKVNFKFIYENFKSISDSTITVTEAEVKKYYDEHIYKYEQEASRDVEYVTFDIVPSKEDFTDAEKWINDIKADFVASEDPDQFINANSDVPYVNKYYKQGELPVNIDSLMFAQPEGFVYGPYFENNTYKIAKLTKIANLPDTVKASHILIQPNEKVPDLARARAIIDSLKVLVDAGASFEELAFKHGTDGTKEKGGDLGWFKYDAMVSPFNDTCFFGKKGDIKIAVTQFGVHLIKIYDKGEEGKKIQVASLERAVTPSQKTFDTFYSQASEFAGVNNTKEKFELAVKDKGLLKKLGSYLKEDTKTISGLDSPRELVRWAFNQETKKGDVSKVFEFGSRYVVAIVTELREKGYATIESVKEELETNVKKDKKAEQLITKLSPASSATSIDDAASKTGLQIQVADNISFSSFSLPGVGVEPDVIVNALEVEKGKLSKPIKGANGIFVLSVTDKIPATELNEVSEKDRLTQTTQSKVDYQAFEALKKAANVVDKRIKFY